MATEEGWLPWPPFEANTNGDKIFTNNPKCGYFKGPGKPNGRSIIKCLQPLVGRYITLQRTIYGTNELLNWLEVIITGKKTTHNQTGKNITHY